jgi:hypothetical protein
LLSADLKSKIRQNIEKSLNFVISLVLATEKIELVYRKVTQKPEKIGTVMYVVVYIHKPKAVLEKNLYCISCMLIDFIFKNNSFQGH